MGFSPSDPTFPVWVPTCRLAPYVAFPQPVHAPRQSLKKVIFSGQDLTFRIVMGKSRFSKGMILQTVLALWGSAGA